MKDELTGWAHVEALDEFVVSYPVSRGYFHVLLESGLIEVAHTLVGPRYVLREGMTIETAMDAMRVLFRLRLWP